MKLSWNCSCGKANSIANRYCVSCKREIPNNIIEQILKDEIAHEREVIRERKSEKIKVRTQKREAWMKNGPTKMTIIICLVFMLHPIVNHYYGYNNMKLLYKQTIAVSKHVGSAFYSIFHNEVMAQNQESRNKVKREKISALKNEISIRYDIATMNIEKLQIGGRLQRIGKRIDR